jgi:glycosyltransferase involved in cell wall biosynthesis/peptidoglycan/xylan/chitin deacetylase (PgdA/CDA1 family)
MSATAVEAIPKVSVVCPFHNEAQFLAEAIETVLGQEFEDFELLLVDDGSTDASTSIAKGFAKRDRRVRYLEHPGHSNRGAGASRNAGIREARAELVAFIDGDDRWRPFKLAEQVDLMERMPDVDAVGGAVNYWASHSAGKDRVVPTGHVRNRRIAPTEATLAMYPLGRAHAPSMSDLMFRRQGLVDVGGFEEQFRDAYEDQAFLGKFYLASTLYFTDRVWSDYRLHSNSCIAETHRQGTYHSARENYLEWFERYLISTDHATDRRIRRAVRRARDRYRSPRERVVEGVRSVPGAVSFVRASRNAARRLRPLLAPGPAILMYHRVADEAFDPWSIAVSPANFADHLDWISANRTPLPLHAFAELHREGKLPRDAIALTFDDGYACAAHTAAPLLRRSSVPATVFIAPDLVDAGREYWWDELERIVLGHKGKRLQLDGRAIHLGEQREEDSVWKPPAPPLTPRQHAYRELWALLYPKPPAAIALAVDTLREQAETSRQARDSHRLMSPEQIRALDPDVVAIGSHTLTHPSLPTLSEEERTREIEASAARCEALTGTRPYSFAYPYGDFEPGLAKLVAAAGFGCACRADGGFVSRTTDPFALPRIFVCDWDSRQLALRLGRP